MIKKIIAILPSYPHYKMNVFSGTNNMSEVKKVAQLLRSDSVVHGDFEGQFVAVLKSKLASKNVYTFGSGRMGFYSILKSIGIEQGDEIIIPSFTCIVVPNAILYCGAKPIYCEISYKDFNIDVEKIEALITEKTKVIYAQHTFGQMCNMEAITTLAKKHNLLVIEDAALALGARDQGRAAGTLGDFGYYSTDRSKVINTGLGGIVSVNNPIYVEKFNNIFNQVPHLSEKFSKKIGWTFIINIFTLHPSIYWLGKFINFLLTKLKVMTYFKDEMLLTKEQITDYPYPARLPNVLAAIGVSQVSELEKNIEHRKRIAKYYNNILKIYPNDYMEREQNIFLRYSFLVKNRDYWEKRFSNKIDLSIWFKSITSGRSNHFELISYTDGQNQKSEFCTKHVFNLPTHNKITPEKLQALLEELKASGDIMSDI